MSKGVFKVSAGAWKRQIADGMHIPKILIFLCKVTVFRPVSEKMGYRSRTKVWAIAVVHLLVWSS
jgi:hypothetical protein